jgi:hypothetical protein
VNADILIRIAQTQSLEGFTGAFTPGTRKGLTTAHSETDIPSSSAAAAAAAATTRDDDSDGGDFSDDDELAHDFERVMDFILTG